MSQTAAHACESLKSAASGLTDCFFLPPTETFWGAAPFKAADCGPSCRLCWTKMGHWRSFSV